MDSAVPKYIARNPEAYEAVAEKYPSDEALFNAAYNGADTPLSPDEHARLTRVLITQNEAAQEELSTVLPEELAERTRGESWDADFRLRTLAELADEVALYRDAGLDITVDDVMAIVIVDGYNPDGSNEGLLEVLTRLLDDVPDEASQRCVRWLATLQGALRITDENRGLHWVSKDLTAHLTDPLGDAVWSASTCRSIEKELAYAKHDDQKRQLLNAAMQRRPDNVDFTVIGRWFKLTGQCVVEEWRHGEFRPFPRYFVAHAALRAAEECSFLSDYRRIWARSYRHIARACIATYAGDELVVSREPPAHHVAARSFFAAADEIAGTNDDRALKYVSKGYRMLENRYRVDELSWEKRKRLHEVAKLATRRFAEQHELEGAATVGTTLQIHEAFKHRARLLAAFADEQYDTVLREHQSVRALAEDVPVYVDLDPLADAVEEAQAEMSTPEYDEIDDFER